MDGAVVVTEMAGNKPASGRQGARLGRASYFFCLEEERAMWRDMWKKKDRLAGGRLTGCKERGEWAELYFMMQAAGLGMRVSKPFGESGKYDVGVENHKRVLRVQVKSTIFTRRRNSYSLNVMGMGTKRKYGPGSLDFFAVLLIPVDEWYIIPFERVALTTTSLHFAPDSKWQKYGPYREAWHLLKETGLTILACADDEWEPTEATPE